MGYPTPTIKLVFGGNAGPDVWRTTIDLAAILTGGDPDNTEMQGILNILDNATTTFWTTLKTFNSASVTYNFAAAYYYPTGATSATALAVNEFANDAGTGAGTTLPVLTALAVEKRTGQAGRRNRGRAYLPFTRPTALSATNQFTAANIIAAVAAYETLLSSLEAADLGSFGISGVVPVVSSPTRTGLPQRISYLQADTIPDVQRRRKSEAVPDNTTQQTVEV